MTGYYAEFIADDSGKFARNGLTFKTKGEAEKYAKDLMNRWYAVREYRIVSEGKKPNYQIKDNTLTRIATKW